MPSPQPPSALRSPRLWIASGLMLAIAAAAFSLLYVGGNLDPKGNLRGLPVALVNEDQSNGTRMNLGDQIVSGVDKPTTGNNKISWQRMNRQEADRRLGQGKVFGALVIPQNFTVAVTELTNPAQNRPSRPTITVLTNQSAGSLGSSMASQATQQAAHTASAHLGTELLHHARAQGTRLAPAAELLLTDPVAITVTDGHPLGSHSGLGLSAFYYSLVLVVCGMLAANVVNSQVDTALGYLHSDVGPFRQRKPVQHTTRVRTLATSITLMTGLAIVMGSLAEAMTVGVLGMDASHLTLLWLYSVSTIAVVGISGLALLAAFGSPGMLLLTIVFIAMAVPTSGATVPLQALPDFFRALAAFEPLRQITDGMRSILYFNAQADAGLTRAWLAMAIALGATLLFGFGVTRFYDHRGLHRIPPPTTPVNTTPTPTAAP